MQESQELNFLSTLLPLSGIVFIIVLGVLLLNQQFNKNLYRQKLEREKLKTRHQQELLRSSIQVQEEERKRIARDLHDELGAALSMSRMHLVQLEEKSKEELLAPLQNVRAMLETALASMRRISHELMPPQLETFGLLKTLETTAAQINKLHGMEMEVNSEAGLERLPLPVELGLYRVCMELINNTIKHAKASRIRIVLRKQGGHLHLQYSDNGIGLPGDDEIAGLGHKSIEARVNSLGGNFSLENGKEAGVIAFADIPLMKPV